MITRREAISLLSSVSVAPLLTRSPSGWPALLAREPGASWLQSGTVSPPLASGAPTSAERMALIDAFRKKSDGVEARFEARTHKSDWTMPYRLFRPAATGRLPLVMYLHGSGGLGDDNLKQMGAGNIFGTRVWAVPENQTRFPCYVVVPQTDRGWVRYAPAQPRDNESRAMPGLGDGARLVFDL